MKFTANNVDSAILNNIVAVLSQLKDESVPNRPIVYQSSGGAFDFLELNDADFDSLSSMQFDDLDSANLPTVQFFTDAARLTLFFEDNSGTSFSSVGSRYYYTPPLTLLNAAATISTTDCQPTYWVTFSFPDGQIIETTYDNARNLVFRSVIVASKKDPKFTINAPQAILVPAGQKIEVKKISTNLGFCLLDFDLYIQLPMFNWSNLSEQQRIIAGNNVNNLIRLALYADRYRANTCTLYDANINGTFVGTTKVIPSDAMLKGVIRICTAYLVSSVSY